MLVSFFESIKYVGLMFPITVLRVYMGYYYFHSALVRYKGDFLVQPRLAASINEWLPPSSAPEFYRTFVETVVVPQWQWFAYAVTFVEFGIGLSFLFGYMVRPFAIFAVFLCYFMLYISSPEQTELLKIFMVVNITLGWVGAGRCLGIDYYFYKRRRGLWW